MDIKQAQTKYDWIAAQLAAGRTVYLSTALRSTALKAKHLPMVRVSNGSLEVQHGKRWIDYSYTNITAR